MFHRSFPDAQAFHVTTLSAEKCCVVNKPSISPQVLRSQLKPWLDLSNVHVFIQPLLGNLWMATARPGTAHPRLGRIVPGDYQTWYMLPADLASKTAKWATDQLTRALQAARTWS